MLPGLRDAIQYPDDVLTGKMSDQSSALTAPRGDYRSPALGGTQEPRHRDASGSRAAIM